MTKKNKIKVCSECQFENGNHSFECSHYKEPKNPMTIPLKENWEKEFEKKWENILFGKCGHGNGIIGDIKPELKSFFSQSCQEAEKLGYEKGYQDGKEKCLKEYSWDCTKILKAEQEKCKKEKIAMLEKLDLELYEDKKLGSTDLTPNEMFNRGYNSAVLQFRGKKETLINHNY